MRIATVLGLLFAFIMAIVAVPSISALQDTGETLSGNLPLVFQRITGLWVIVGGTIGLLTIAGIGIAIARAAR
jgi:hypothetical protein